MRGSGNCPCEPAGDELRAERRGLDRLPGGGRRALRPGLGSRLGLERRAHLDERAAGVVLPPARFLLTPDPVRQARHRVVRPRGRHRRPRDPHGRRARGHGRGRLRDRGRDRRLRGRADEHPLRGHLPGALPGARHLRVAAAFHARARLPVRDDARGDGARQRGGRAALGHRRAGALVPRTAKGWTRRSRTSRSACDRARARGPCASST